MLGFYGGTIPSHVPLDLNGSTVPGRAAGHVEGGAPTRHIDIAAAFQIPRPRMLQFCEDIVHV